MSELDSSDTAPDHNLPTPSGGPSDDSSSFSGFASVGQLFDFIRAPVTDNQPAVCFDEIKSKANDYFSRCAEKEIFPNLSGLALALGLPSVSSVERLGRRRPEVRRAISQCITALSFYQEHGMIHGLIRPQVGTYMLKHLQGFDVEEPEGSAPVKFWSDTQRHEVEVHGVVEHRRGEDMSPQEAYLFVLNGGKLPEKVVNNLLEESTDETADYFEEANEDSSLSS